jgi:dTMP kinase
VRKRHSQIVVNIGSPLSPGQAVKGGFLVVFEGIGGSGKSTLARRLGEGLHAAGWAVRATREPGGTELGSAIRTILLRQGGAPDPWAEAFLFEADRAQTYSEVLRPSLEAGAIVISDRGPLGTIAYQGYGRALDLSLIDAMSETAWRGLKADLVFVVDVEPRLGLARKRASQEDDRFDQEDLDFQSRAREGYLFAAKRIGADAVVLDGASAPDVAFGQVWERTVARLEARRVASGGMQE